MLSKSLFKIHLGHIPLSSFCLLEQVSIITPLNFTGVSCSVPDLTCLMSSLATESFCSVCTDAISPMSKNRRNNTSIMLRYAFDHTNPTSNIKNILIDCGKVS